VGYVYEELIEIRPSRSYMEMVAKYRELLGIPSSRNRRVR